MKRLSILAVLALAACSPQQERRVVAVAQAVCTRDATAQAVIVPLAVPVAQAIAPSSTGPVGQIVAIDQTVVHPAIVAACAGIQARATGAVVAGK